MLSHRTEEKTTNLRSSLYYNSLSIRERLEQSLKRVQSSVLTIHKIKREY